MVVPGNQIGKLPGAAEVRRQLGGTERLEQEPEQPLVELMSEVEFPLTPARVEPGARHDKEHSLAAIDGLVKRTLPAFAGGYPALGVEIKKNVIPALPLQPVAQGDGLGIVAARVTQKDARH